MKTKSNVDKAAYKVAKNEAKRYSPVQRMRNAETLEKCMIERIEREIYSR